MIPPYRIIIPARYASTRLPAKPLVRIGDRSLIQHVYTAALASGAREVIIATDNEEIRQEALSFGAHVVMTATGHHSGTDRINEVLTKTAINDDEIIVNLQGDELGMEPEMMDRLASVLHADTSAVMATLCMRIKSAEVYFDPHSVKVVMNSNKHALYFSRSPLPWQDGAFKEDSPVYKHIGLYAYYAGFLREFASLPRAPMEISESLEQLRALYHGYGIYVEEIPEKTGLDINTFEDLARAREIYGHGA